MSILRYEQLPGAQSAPAPMSVGDACLLLLGIAAAVFLLAAGGLTLMLTALTPWVGKAAAVWVLLVLLSGAGASGWWVLRPMWTRCWRDQAGAWGVLLLGIGLAGLYLGLAGLGALCFTGRYCF